MSRFLVDTNVLLRIAATNDLQHAVALSAIGLLFDAGLLPCLTTQVACEFLAVATRPPEANGLGLNHAAAIGSFKRMTRPFGFLADSQGVYELLLEIIERYRVTGKVVHDARLVATMLANEVPQILTFNPDDFRRFAPEIQVLEPERIAS